MTENNKNSILKIGAKMRIVLAIVAVVALAGGVMLYIHHRSEVNLLNQGSANVSGTPDIQSIPGAGDPSNQYVNDQNQQNLNLAEKARKNATSFVPTITRPNFVGNPNEFGVLPALTPKAPAARQSKECPIKKVVVMYKPNPASCSLNNLRLARKVGVTAEELVCQGCSCPLLKDAGYGAGDLKAIGYSAKQLRKCGFTLGQLVAAGYSAADLKNAGFSAKALANHGFTPGQLAAAGFSNAQIKHAGFTAAQLKKAGILSAANKKATSTNCSVKRLKKLRAEGVSALALKNQGCGLVALKAAGYTAAQLKAAGFTAAQLKKAGYTAAQLKAAGFSASQLRNAGFSAAALKKAGFTAAQLKQAGFNAGQLKAAGFSASQLKAAGFSAKQLHNAGFTAAQLKQAGYNAAQLKKAGYTKGDLLRAGFTPNQAGYKTASSSAQESKQSGSAAKHGGSSNANANGAGATMPSIVANTPEAKLAKIAKLEQQQMNAQQRADAVAQMQGAMAMQAQTLMSGWSNHGTQTLAKAPATVSNNNSNSSGENGNNSGNNSGPVVKAGTVMFAVLDTAIDSDEKSPIMAKIVTGPLKGAKLLGQFTRVNKRLLLSFNLMNDPSYKDSLPLNAVAIDPDTARTALAGEVNNHYLLRYGTLFASAFLEGISNAIMSSGSTTQCSTGIGCVFQHPKLNTAQQVAVGLGSVGNRFGSALGNVYDTPPTIKIPGGTGIGVLVMSDLHLPANVDYHPHTMQNYNPYANGAATAAPASDEIG